MKTATFFAVLASAAMAVGAALPEMEKRTWPAKTTPAPTTGGGQCSGDQHPACCNQGSLLAIDCTLGAVLGTCNGVQACCNVQQNGLINLGGLCLQI